MPDFADFLEACRGTQTAWPLPPLQVRSRDWRAQASRLPLLPFGMWGYCGLVASLQETDGEKEDLRRQMASRFAQLRAARAAAGAGSAISSESDASPIRRSPRPGIRREL
eukprot:s6469_g2.t1